MQHIEACCRACRGDLLPFSFVRFRARVASLGMMAAVGCLPSIHALCMSPQVCEEDIFEGGRHSVTAWVRAPENKT